MNNGKRFDTRRHGTPYEYESERRDSGFGRKKIDEETIEIVYPTTAKERVEQELDELNGKIVKLTCFLYGRKIAERVVTAEMRALLSFVFLRCFVCGGCLNGEA